MPIMVWLGPLPGVILTAHARTVPFQRFIITKGGKTKAPNSTWCLCPEATCGILFILTTKDHLMATQTSEGRKRNLSMCLERKRNVWWASINDYIIHRTAIPLSFAGKIFTSLCILWIMNIHISVKILLEDWRLIKFDIWLYLPASWNIFPNRLLNG